MQGSRGIDVRRIHRGAEVCHRSLYDVVSAAVRSVDGLHGAEDPQGVNHAGNVACSSREEEVEEQQKSNDL